MRGRLHVTAAHLHVLSKLQHAQPAECTEAAQWLQYHSARQLQHAQAPQLQRRRREVRARAVERVQAQAREAAQG